MTRPGDAFCPRCGSPTHFKIHGGRERAACPDEQCAYVFWNNPVPVVAAIAQRDDSVILVQSHGWPTHWFGLVTGFLEAGESAEEAVLREVSEELGLTAELGSFIGIYPFHRMNQVILAYHVTLGRGDIQLEKAELSAYREVLVENLVPWPTGTGIALRDWLRSRGIEKDFLEMR